MQADPESQPGSPGEAGSPGHQSSRSAEIITIGTELLLGHLVDTNTPAIAAELADNGIDVYRTCSVGDNRVRIAQAVREAVSRASAVICAGGLGPTVDDVTRDGIADAAGVALVRDDGVAEQLRRYFTGLGRTMSPNNERQALFPAGATILENPYGTAPGFALDVADAIVIALPGPPRELLPMLREKVVPLLRSRWNIRAAIVSRIIRTAGVSESEIDRRIEDLFRASENPSIAVLTQDGEVIVKVTGKAPNAAEARALCDTLVERLVARLGASAYSTDGASLPETVGRCLRERGLTLAAAESCTGGLVGALVTSVAGASDYFRGSIVAYGNRAKTELLDVAPPLIERHGAVSAEVAAAMAEGAKAALGASLAVAVTGIAGPSGGTQDKPVGLVYVALVGEDDACTVQRLQLPGAREMVQRRAALAALLLVLRTCREKRTGG
jgi:nicotinamide-nucleotide amidase